MKGNDLMKAMNGIDEKYLSESEKIITKDRKLSKRTFKVAVSIAAAAALAIPVGAYAYNTFIHRDNVEQYLTNTELIEQQSPDAVKNYVTENDDYRITVDTVLSDGNIVMMVLTHEPKTDKGMQIKAHVGGCPGACITYADGSEGPFEQNGVPGIPMTRTLGGYADTKETDSVSYEKTVSLFSCKDIDLSREVKVEFFADERGRSGALKYFINRNDSGYEGRNELEGLECTTSFAPNVKCVQLHSADGKTISMSSFDVYSDDPSVICAPNSDMIDDSANQFFITNSGEKKPLEQSFISIGSDYGLIIYGEYVDLDGFKGVEINGVEYLK